MAGMREWTNLVPSAPEGFIAMTIASFEIDINEQFEHLPNAPIVEAVIHWRARSRRI
jgi:hypothetical protein